MKICHVDPGCGIPIPPPSWGAIEKIIWEFKQNQEKLGHQVEIRMANDISPGEFDIVHCHVANLTQTLRIKKIPYIFQLHDHHAFFYGKSSPVFLENLEAIKKSLISLIPANYLVEYFDSHKGLYFPHGVNTDFYYPDNNKPKVREFLMLANNNFTGDPSMDRKGFTLGLALASLLNKSITIAGPSDNKQWLNNNPWVLMHPKLKLVFDPTQEEVRELYQTHKIFLHPSALEAGHPNLTMIEAAACGMPIIANWESSTDFHGAWRAPRDIFEMERGYRDIINNFEIYSSSSLKTAQKLNWYNRSKDLIKIYKRFI